MDPQVFATLKRVRDEQDASKVEELKAQSNENLAKFFVHPGNAADLEELAFDLLNITWQDTMDTNVINQIIEVKTVGLGDPDYVNENLRGMRAYWQGKGGQILSDIIRYERATMPKEEQVAAIDMHQDELALDFWGTLDKLVTQANEKLSQLPVTRLIELIQAGVAVTPYFGNFASATLTDTQLDPILEAVAQRSKGKVTILGSRQAIRKLTSIGLDFGPALQQQIFETGEIGRYKGYPVVQVENFEDFAGNLVLPIDELWLMGQNAGRLTYYGAQAKVQQLRLPSFYLRWETARDAGMLLYGASKGRVGRVVLS
ncbi:MAG: hypothetical protein NVS3B1_07910 [Marmoricola sp.]